MRYRITDCQNNIFEIDEHGCFLRYNKNLWTCPHDSWKCVGFYEKRAFGRMQFKPLTSVLALLDLIPSPIWSFKNGKPRFFIGDIDHGTRRIQTAGIRTIQKIEGA